MKALNKLNVSKFITINNKIKALIGESLGPIAKSVGYTTYNAKLTSVFETFMKDENAEVRLGVAKSIYEIFIASDQALLSSVQTIIGAFQKDNQYKIREKIINTLCDLGIAYGLEVFKVHLEALYFTYLTDPVHSVRETGIRCLDKLSAKFGSSWTINTLIPKLMNQLSQPKTSYINRMTVLSSISICAKNLNATQVNDNVIANLLKYLKDKIPNVRFFIIKQLSIIGQYIDSSGKDKCKR